MEAENGIETEMENQVEADPGNNDKRVAIDTEIQDGMNSENNNMNRENDIIANDIGEEEIAQGLEKEKTEEQDDSCKETAEVAIKEKNMEKTKNEKEIDKENVVEKEPNNNITTTSGSISSSIAKFGAPVQKKEKGMFRVVQTEKCAACQKTVYAMEKLEMNGHNYHRNCFKCSHCSARLTPKTFSMNEGVIYCTNHFKQLFARKGNYDEGFGRQQYKKKWQDDKPKNEDSTASA